MTEKILKNKKTSSFMAKTLIFAIALLSIIILFAMFAFILKESIPALKGRNIIDIYFSTDVTKHAIIPSLVVTLATSFISVAFSLPIALRLSIIIRYRLKRFSKLFRIITDILAGIPSVVYGVFAYYSLGKFSGFITGTKSSITIFNASVMLSLMIIPTMSSLITNQLFLVPNHLLESSIALGNTRTKAIYSVALKSIRSGIVIACLLALTRAIGETMAVSMLLNRSAASSSVFTMGLRDFLNSGLATLSAYLSNLIFTDADKPDLRQIAFAMGLGLFFIVMILVLIVTIASKKKRFKAKPLFKRKEVRHILWDIIRAPFVLIYYLFHYIYFCFITILKYIQYVFDSIFRNIFDKKEYRKPWKKIFKKDLSTNNLMVLFESKNKIVNKSKPSNQYIESSKKIYNYYMIFWEIFCAVFTIGIVCWILHDVFFYGSKSFNKYDWKIDSPGVINAFIWTILLIVLTITLCFPLALFMALFLTEYSRNNWFGKIVKFFIDVLGGTPTIIFGLFGWVFFLQTLHLHDKSASTSLIAGGLTMVFVVLPTYARSIEQVMANVPQSYRLSSLSLGATRWQTIKKIIIPQTLSGIISGTILSMSRIISESAPVYLTLGSSFNPHFGLGQNGYTLTTYIYFHQVFGMGNEKAKMFVSYKYALATIIMIMLLICLSYVTEPITNWFRNLKRKRLNKKYQKWGQEAQEQKVKT